MQNDRATYVGLNGVGTVVFVPFLARPARQAAPSLRTDASRVARLEVRDPVADAGDGADNFVSDHKRKLRLAPSLREGMDIRAADTAVGDGYLDVLGGKGLRPEFCDLEVIPLGWISSAV